MRPTPTIKYVAVGVWLLCGVVRVVVGVQVGVWPHFLSPDSSIAKFSELPANQLTITLAPKNLGNMPNHTGVDPNYTLAPLPNPKDSEQCRDQWKTWFTARATKENENDLTCCYERKACECIEKLNNSSGSTVPCKAKDCDPSTQWEMSKCMSVAEAVHPKGEGGSSSGFSWWWILVIVAVIVIIVIVVAIGCVYRKKFCGKDSKKDRKHARVTVGPMNVKSDVQWEGKNRHSKARHSSARRKRTSAAKPSRQKRGASSAPSKHSKRSGKRKATAS